MYSAFSAVGISVQRYNGFLVFLMKKKKKKKKEREREKKKKKPLRERRKLNPSIRLDSMTHDPAVG